MEEAGARRRLLWTGGGRATQGGGGLGGTGGASEAEEGCGGASAAAGARGEAAVFAAPATGAGEEGNSGECLRAAQVMKSLGEKPRSKRATRGIQGRLSSALAHAG